MADAVSSKANADTENKGSVSNDIKTTQFGGLQAAFQESLENGIKV